MKTTIKGMDAFTKMFTIEVPEKTKSYTPISHSSIIGTIRREIADAGFKIDTENYRCSNDGKIALGTISIVYKEDPDIQLGVSFINSYNKQHAFKFTLGAIVKVCNNGMILSNDSFGMFKKVHKGDADILSKGKIAEALTHAGKYWDTLVKHKNKLTSRHLSTSERNSILGELFFDSSILSGMQLNIIKKEIEKPSFDYGRPDTAWALYNHITLALKETHPADWIDHQIALHDVFKSYMPIEVEPALLPSGIADLYTKFTGSDYGVTSTTTEYSSITTTDTVAIYKELPF